ncbi:hypothetical protein AB0N87_42165 [Streptomyces sp. NPDC093228]|uniref:hypothetical protein n=1 Tax=Streptomyces sp. NPDC093228 TaxID=3155070 RepID=UPI003441B3BA
MLTLYQALRTAVVEAGESRPGTDLDRCGFTTALHTARNLGVQATGVTGHGTAGVIGRRILAQLLPPRRPGISTLKVESPRWRLASTDPPLPEFASRRRQMMQSVRAGRVEIGASFVVGAESYEPVQLAKACSTTTALAGRGQ